MTGEEIRNIKIEIVDGFVCAYTDKEMVRDSIAEAMATGSVGCMSMNMKTTNQITGWAKVVRLSEVKERSWNEFI